MIKILALAGSSRKDSFNKKALEIAASAAEKEDHHVTDVDIAEYSIPIFNQDLEAEHGMPEKAHDFELLSAYFIYISFQ